MPIFFRFNCFLIGFALLSACSKSSDSPTSGTTSTTNVVASTLTKLKTAVPDVSDGVSLLNQNIPFYEEKSYDLTQGPDFSLFGTALTSHLSKSNFMYPGNNGGSEITPVAYLEAILSDSLTGPDDAVFKRANMAFLIACAIDTLAIRGDALYSTSQTSMVMVASTVSAACGSFSEINQMNGTTISFSVENLSDTTNYDQKISMLSSQGTNGTTFGSTKNQYMYVRNNSSVLSFMHLELDSSNSSGFSSYLYFDKGTSSGRFQYASINGTSNKHLYRIHVDSSANTTTVLTFNVASGTKWAKVYARSTAASQTQAAISLSWAGMSTAGGASAAVTDGNACFNISGSASVASDNTLTCSSAVTLPGPASDSDTLYNTTFGLTSSGKAYSDISALSTTSTGAAFAPSFSSTTLPSAALGF